MESLLHEFLTYHVSYDIFVSSTNLKISLYIHLYIFLSLDSLLQVNMSIAILPMATEFNWNPATVGLIQSSFFWGYLLTQVFPKLCSF